MDAKKLENPTEEMSRQITEGRADRPAHSEEVDPSRNQINADSDTLLPCRAVGSKVSSEPMLAETGQQVSEPVQTWGLHGQGPGGSDPGGLILGAVRSGWPGACHQGRVRGRKTLQNGCGVCSHTARGGRDTLRSQPSPSVPSPLSSCELGLTVPATRQETQGCSCSLWPPCSC